MPLKPEAINMNTAMSLLSCSVRSAATQMRGVPLIRYQYGNICNSMNQRGAVVPEVTQRHSVISPQLCVSKNIH